MRKIEKEMLDAVKNRKNWKKANTEVTFNSDNSSRVLLHGNQIAVLADNNNILFSLAGWKPHAADSTPFLETLVLGLFSGVPRV